MQYQLFCPFYYFVNPSLFRILQIQQKQLIIVHQTIFINSSEFVKMDRRIVLRMLFEKSDEAQQFLKQKLNNDIHAGSQLIDRHKHNYIQDSSPQSPHIIFKRMQLLQMGKCKIKAPQESIQSQNRGNRQNKREQNFSIHIATQKTKNFSVSLQKKSSRQLPIQSSSQVSKFCQDKKVIFQKSDQKERPHSSGSRLMRKTTIKRPNNSKAIFLCQQQDLNDRRSQTLKDRLKQRQIQARNSNQDQNNETKETQRLAQCNSNNFLNFDQQNKQIHTQMTFFDRMQNDLRCQNSKQSISHNTNNNEWVKKAKYNDRRSFSSFNKKAKAVLNQTFNSNVQKDMLNKQQQQKKNKIIMRKQIHRNYAKAFVQPPKISSQSYIISQIGRKDGYKVHFACQSKNMVQVASLTKIMTCLVAIQFSEKCNLILAQQKVQIGRFQSNVGGTSARIKMGQIYTLEQLLYGLMLPSGNDASLAIAVHIGSKLLIQDFKQKNNKQKLTKQNQSALCTQFQNLTAQISKKQRFQRFVMEMNNKAKSLGMSKTSYANSHGLVNNMNKSCAFDLSILCEYALNNDKFAQIVSTKHYNARIEYKSYSSVQQSERENNQTETLSRVQNKCISKRLVKNKCKDTHLDDSFSNSEQDDMEIEQTYSQTQQTNFTLLNSQANLQVQTKDSQFDMKTRYVSWQNTHRLLHQKSNQYVGIKTGVTKMAGPCLASCVKSPNGRKFIIIVLNCKKMTLRFKETEVLKKWVFKKQGISIKKSEKRQKTQNKQQKKVKLETYQVNESKQDQNSCNFSQNKCKLEFSNEQIANVL